MVFFVLICQSVIKNKLFSNIAQNEVDKKHFDKLSPGLETQFSKRGHIYIVGGNPCVKYNFEVFRSVYFDIGKGKMGKQIAFRRDLIYYTQQITLKQVYPLHPTTT